MTAADPASRGGPIARATGWLRGHVPTREAIGRNRLLRPVAHRILAPTLWRFTRRSVPRGVALGAATGVLFPFAHMPLAAALAFPARANVPVAVAATLINNPFTFLPIGWAAFHVGRWVLRLDREVPGHPVAANLDANAGWLHWLLERSGPTLVGLLLIAIAAATIGYVGASFAWRWRTARKWRRRHTRRI